MGWAYAVSLALTLAALAHLGTIHIAEPEPQPRREDGAPKYVDVRGALECDPRRSRALMLLILLAAFNNLLGGVFMALMDAYGLSLVSVETWGFLWGFISLAFIVGGLVVATVRTRIERRCASCSLGNLVNWIVCAMFTLRSSIVLLDDRHVRLARC